MNFPSFVDERAEAESGDDGSDSPDPTTEETEQHHGGHGHQQATPQHVCDVERLAADLRIAGDVKVAADAEDGRGGREQEVFEVLADVDAPHRAPMPNCRAPGGTGRTRNGHRPEENIVFRQ